MKMQAARLVLTSVLGIASVVQAETHWQVQAVDASGIATYSKVDATPNVSNQIILQGVVLNNPEDMLNAAYNAPAWIGAQWQVYFQGLAGDHAGTALWVGQMYSRMGGVDYTSQEWADELQGLNYTGTHQLRQGDLVRVTGYGDFHNGKTNINERHSTSPIMKFTVEWLNSSPGMPSPEVITLSDVKDAANQDRFYQDRLAGGEYYQGRMVRINNVHFAGGSWGSDQTMTLADDTGRSLPLLLGHNPAFAQSCRLGTRFDVVGIFDQDYGNTTGYRVWVTGYDGSTNLLGILHKPGDIDNDNSVNLADLKLLVAAWNATPAAGNWNPCADLDADIALTLGDLKILVANWNQ